jgi:hypothetical protein
MQNLLKRATLEQNKVMEFRSLGSQVAFTLMNALSTAVLALTAGRWWRNADDRARTTGHASVASAIHTTINRVWNKRYAYANRLAIPLGSSFTPSA